MADRQGDPREREARRILERVNKEADSHGGQVYDRSLQKLSGSDDDWAERTGKRIARYLSAALFAGLVVWLLAVMFGFRW